VLPLSALSRRALVAAPALAAVAPAAGAKRKGRRKRKRHRAPQASALAILTDIGLHDAGSGPTFSCAVEWVVVYPAGPASHRAVFPINVAGTTTGAQKRAALAAEVRTHAVEFLQARGFDLPGERIDAPAFRTSPVSWP
jgi:hypothetical protein